MNVGAPLATTPQPDEVHAVYGITIGLSARAGSRIGRPSDFPRLGRRAVCGTVAGTLANWKTGILGACAAARRHAETPGFSSAPPRGRLLCAQVPTVDQMMQRVCGLKRRTTAAS